jgi:methionyl-tRNA formyltransferase
MRLAFLGTPQFALPTLSALIAAGHEIACVYSQPAAPRGRGRAVRPSPVAALAAERGLVVRTPASLRDPAEIAAFAELGLDAAVVAAFGQILPREVLEAPGLGCFNLHASLLPRWRGAAPIQRAIMAGDAVTGVAVMAMSEGLDEGPVVSLERVGIDAADTAGSLAARLAAVGAPLMVEAMAEAEAGTAVFTPQAAEGATYARKIRRSETRLRFDRPAAEVDARIRGLSPAPGAWFEVPSDKGPVRIKALLSRVEEAEGAPGTVLDGGLLIACAGGAVRILRAQREGRAAAPADELLRGFPIPAGVALS